MITITDKGAERVNHFLETRQAGIGIRVKITTTGCSGYAYQLEFADETNSEDTIFESNGVKIIVDPKSLIMVDGTHMDYIKEGINAGFSFKNPMEDETCGCGESFTLKK
ncbi:MAG: iron-sulfur cluster assembly accessory protein [Candidatus Endolissoclinum sp.]|jgi:iron-sulfur cluster assembly protein|nr:iron-sulfur cluster assembly accessory protein [Candidatus Endolissoclinum sp.]|tara:strand:+ start:93 stop:419 length:327 start_codon:yes stop_codon:yes gene_type:complete